MHEAGVVCTRNGVVESAHRVHAVAVEGSGRILASCGHPDWPVVYRSAAKPFQAVPLVEEGVADQFGFSGPELALCCASHNGEPIHVQTAAKILEKVGAEPEELKLGPHPPLRPEAAEALFREDGTVLSLHNNCSGQHAGMLGLARIKGWPTETYLEREHPLQRRMLEEVARFTGLPQTDISEVVDGCGMVAFGVPLVRMAVSFATLGVLASTEHGPARIVEAMTSHPFLLGGTERLCTDLPIASRGRILGKLGAEGVYGIALPSEGLGIAVKIEDGGFRALDPAVLRVLEELAVLSEAELEELSNYRRKPIRNTLGHEVGEIRAEFSLKRPGLV